jgi:hypothetical protein
MSQYSPSPPGGNPGPGPRARIDDPDATHVMICQSEAVIWYGETVVHMAIGFHRHHEHPVSCEACWYLAELEDIVGLIAIAGRVGR